MILPYGGKVGHCWESFLKKPEELLLFGLFCFKNKKHKFSSSYSYQVRIEKYPSTSLRMSRLGLQKKLYSEVRSDKEHTLFKIAWYGGNSGVKYKGAYDCSTWYAKQYSSSHCGTKPVKGKTPNRWGLYDMLGNVWEWCWDWHSKSYRGRLSVDPRGPSSGSDRVFRGGSWFSHARSVRSSLRDGGRPSNRSLYVGFRFLREGL